MPDYRRCIVEGGIFSWYVKTGICDIEWNGGETGRIQRTQITRRPWTAPYPLIFDNEVLSPTELFYFCVIITADQVSENLVLNALNSFGYP